MKTNSQRATKLIKELRETNEFHEDLEPGEVAWLLQVLVDEIAAQAKTIELLQMAKK